MFDQIYVEEVIMKQNSEPRDRLLSFSGAKNFRDLGGYQTADEKTVRWNVLYRSDNLHKLSASDLRRLSGLNLNRVIDFRSEQEVQQEPDRLPAELNDRLLKIPILDSTTKATQESRSEFIKNLKNANPTQYMLQTYTELATKFTPQFKQFVGEVLSANGKPVVFHCAAGKDRTGFAAAILLRMLGVPQETVTQDYLLTNQYLMTGYAKSLFLLRLIKGKAFAATVGRFMEARSEYLVSAFDTVNRQYGSFDDYVFKALDLTKHDTERLKTLYLE